MRTKKPRKIKVDNLDYCWKTYQNDDYPRFIKIWKDKNNIVYHDVSWENEVTPSIIEQIIRTLED